MSSEGLSGMRLLVVGTSSGIGRAVAIASARAGASVVLSARRRDRLEESVAACGERASSIVADVREAGGCDDLVEGAIDELGGLDAVIYAAGASDLALVTETSSSEWSRVLESNVVGAALVFAAASKELAASNGQFVALSSVSIFRPKPGLVPYAASKAALHALFAGLRVENPDVAFSLVVVGPTEPSDFARDFEPSQRARFTKWWTDIATLAPGTMSADDVAMRIVDCVASPMRTEELVLVPRPGPARRPDGPQA